jgi:hypothetical protein
VHDHALAQLVERLGGGARPVFRQRVAGARVRRGEPARDLGKPDVLERPALHRAGGVVERLAKARAQVVGQRCGLGRAAERLQPALQCRARARRERLLAEIGQRIERGARIAAAGELAGEVARLDAEPRRLFPEQGLVQAQHRAPALHCLAELVHRDGARRLPVVDLAARLRKDLAGRRAQARGRPGLLAFRLLPVHGACMPLLHDKMTILPARGLPITGPDC